MGNGFPLQDRLARAAQALEGITRVGILIIYAVTSGELGFDVARGPAL